MIKVSKQLFEALELGKNRYNGDINAMLEGHSTNWHSECESLNKLSHIELAKLLIIGYELEKVEYTRNNTPRQFRCKFEGGRYEYTADRYGDDFILMWIDEDNNLNGTIYNEEDIIKYLNEGRVTITKTIMANFNVIKFGRYY